MLLENRTDAGRKLAGLLSKYAGTDAPVLAIPRGGVVVGYEVAKALGLPLDVVVPRKLGAPGEPELAIGAVASWGDHEWIVDESALRYLRVSDDYMQREVQAQLAEINRRLLEYRGTTDPPNVEGKTVILVDDGIATGYTMQAAVMSLRRLDPARIVLAVPIASPEAAARLSELVDEFCALTTPYPFLAVGHWYVEFGQTTDEEVIELLRKRRSELSGANE
jgi:predicted phosphoribosyltransferase